MFKILLVVVVACSWSVHGAAVAENRGHDYNEPLTNIANLFPAVKNQGNCTGCGYAFAAVGILEACMQRNYGKSVAPLR